MSNEKFKVKFGLAVGDVAGGSGITTVDGTTGETIVANGTTGQVTIGGSTQGKLEIGQQNRATSGTPYLDFHSSATPADYDVRMLVSGGNSTNGNGDLTITANSVTTSEDLSVTGILSVGSVGSGASIITPASSAAIFSGLGVTSLSLGGGATSFSMGADSGTLTIGNPTVVGTQATQNLYNTVATTMNFAGAATTTNIVTGVTASGNTKTINLGTGGASGSTTNINIGSSTAGALGTVTVNENTTMTGTLDVAGNTTLTGTLAVNASGGITTNQTTFPIANTTATTINFGGAATTTNIGSATGSSIINGTNRFTSPAIFNFAGSNNYRGLMVSNGNAGSTPLARTGVVVRTFPTATQPRGGLFFENARGTETTPTALQGPTTTAAPDFLGEIFAGGRSSTGWITDLVAASPLGFTSYATENWVAATNCGTGWALQLQPTATTLTAGGTSRISTIDSSPQGLQLRADTHGFSKGKTIQFVATGCSTSGTTLTIGTLTSGSVTVGSMIQNSTNLLPAGTYIVANISGSGSGSTWTLNQSVSTYTSVLAITGQQGYVAYTGTGDVDVIGDLTLRGNDIKNSAGTTCITLSTTAVTSALPIQFPVYTVAGKPVTGAVGQQIAISDSTGNGGRMAYWDGTNSRWNYVSDDVAV